MTRAAAGSSGGVVCEVRGDHVVILASEGSTPDQQSACGPLIMGDLSLPLPYAATTGQPVWLVSQADAVDRFPRTGGLVPGSERAYATRRSENGSASWRILREIGTSNV